MKNHYNVLFSVDYLEDVSSMTDTVPDQSLSVQEILRRFTSGTLLPSDMQRPTYYDEGSLDDEDFDDIEDMADVSMMQQFVNEKIEAIKIDASARASDVGVSEQASEPSS